MGWKELNIFYKSLIITAIIFIVQLVSFLVINNFTPADAKSPIIPTIISLPLMIFYIALNEGFKNIVNIGIIVPTVIYFIFLFLVIFGIYKIVEKCKKKPE